MTATYEASQGRVLLVDDQEQVLASYARSLANAGFEVSQASSGTEALRCLTSHYFDAVFSDLWMPEIDGLSLLRRIRELSLDTAVVIMFDAKDNQAAIEATELGAMQWLLKPIDAVALRESAARAVKLGRSRRNETFDIKVVNAGKTESITATEAKNEFGQVLEKAIRGETVYITRHDVPKAVLVSLDRFKALSRRTETQLNTLSEEFDSLLQRMQTPEARAARKAAFDASPKEIGKAAVAMAQRQRLGTGMASKPSSRRIRVPGLRATHTRG